MKDLSHLDKQLEERHSLKSKKEKVNSSTTSRREEHKKEKLRDKTKQVQNASKLETTKKKERNPNDSIGIKSNKKALMGDSGIMAQSPKASSSKEQKLQ